MKTRKIITYLVLPLFALAISFSCDITREPYDKISTDRIMDNPNENLASLLNGCYGYLKEWSDPMYRCGEYAGDNIMIRGTSTDAFYEFISFSRTPNNYRLQSFWDRSYKVIAQTSNIMALFKEGENEDVDNSLGEAYFLRGLCYFYLTRAYGRPYYQSPETNLGVPIVNGTPDDLVNLSFPDRSTVKESYAQVIADMEKALSLLKKKKKNTFATEMAAKAMLSRIYLFMSGTYEQPNAEYAKLAVKYADEVIASGTYQLLGNERFMKYNTYTPEANSETIFAIKRVAFEFSGYAHYYGIGGMYAYLGGMGWGEMYASAKYLALLDETGRNDWSEKKIVDARASFIEPQYAVGANAYDVFRFIHPVKNKSGQFTNFNYEQFKLKREGDKVSCVALVNKKEVVYPLTLVKAEDRSYSITYEDVEYTGVIDKYIRLNRAYPMFYITKCSREGEESHLHSPVMIRLGEVHLNRAEAQAKLGNYGEALKDLNLIRERSLPGKGYDALTAENASKLIDKERQLELAFQAERSYDVFRNGQRLERRYPGPHGPMEDVEPTDYRVIYFIPQNAINAYPGTLTQNPTSN